MARWVSRFWLEEDGQDLIEYSLILTIFALMTLALVGGEAPKVNAIWTAMQGHLNDGSTMAAGN
jgi:Flp pilus assembly pilin Flp